jgi:hypothetical protein
LQPVVETHSKRHVQLAQHLDIVPTTYKISWTLSHNCEVQNSTKELLKPFHVSEE